MSVDADAHARVGAIGDHGFDVGGVDIDLLVEAGAFVGIELFPVGQLFIPFGAFGGELAALQVGEGRFIGGDHAAAGAHFDAHIADGHAGFHREVADGGAGVFDEIAGGAAGGDLCDDIEDDVFGDDAFVRVRHRH